MPDDLRRFSTDAFPEDLRRSAWSEALAAVLCGFAPGDAGSVSPPLEGYVSARSTALDSVFVRLSSSPQAFVPKPSGGRGGGSAVLMFALLEGVGRVSEASETVPLGGDAIVVLDPTRPWRIDLDTHFRALAVKIESAAFVLRLLRTGRRNVNTISSATGVGAMCQNVVRSIADGIERLSRQDLLSIEATLTDLLVSCLSHVDEQPEEDPTSVQLGHLRRVCRTLEARLGDPELDIDAIGRLEGLSTRYVQRLFKAGATTFGDYLRERRLERCRIDLANRSLDHFTIAELCFRWGFGDAANFSRAFTARFGISPRSYRASPVTDVGADLQRGRPPSQSASKPAPRGHAPGVRDPGRSAFADVLGDHARAATAPMPKDAPIRQTGRSPERHYIAVSDRSVHWGYFSRTLDPVASVRSGDIVTIETLTQHASDDRERMIDGDPGAESVFHWTAEAKAVDRRGAGPADASIFGRGAGEGFGVHICTGPVHVQGAEPGDVLEIRILDIRPRPSCSEKHRGRVFGSNAATWWGFHYRDLLTEPKKREVVTLYEIDAMGDPPCARAVYNFRWTPQIDPFGVRHDTIDYPGVPVDERSVVKRYGVLADARVPIRPHFGVLALAPRESELIDSIPPGYFGGNLDNWRAGKGATLFLPVSVPGALFSAGDPHASQGDSELCGTAIECSLTGEFQLVLHKRAELAGSFLADLNFPFLETADAWVLQGLSYPNHLAELGPDAQAAIYRKSSLEAAMRDAFHKTRRYLMQAHRLDEDEAISLISVAVDFGITQVVDGNWGVHAVIDKAIFPNAAAAATSRRR